MFNEKLFAKKLEGLEPYIVDTGKYKARLDANESFISLDDNIRKKTLVWLGIISVILIFSLLWAPFYRTAAVGIFGV